MRKWGSHAKFVKGWIIFCTSNILNRPTTSILSFHRNKSLRDFISWVFMLSCWETTKGRGKLDKRQEESQGDLGRLALGNGAQIGRQATGSSFQDWQATKDNSTKPRGDKLHSPHTKSDSLIMSFSSEEKQITEESSFHPTCFWTLFGKVILIWSMGKIF